MHPRISKSQFAAVFLMLAIARVCGAQMAWQERALERTNHGCATDTQGGRLLLWGGSRPNGTLVAPTLWSWNGSTWQALASSTGPSSRRNHSLVFDASRNALVLFGGQGSQGQPLGDTWEWDGFEWRQASVGGPSPRWDHAMVYESTRSRSLLFGGQDNQTSFADTWEWTGGAWLQRTVPGPTPRSGHAMAHDSARSRSVLFGPGAETWEWTGSGWQAQIFATQPPPRVGHAIAFDASRNRTVLFGGTSTTNSQDLGDTWEWNGVNWVQVPASGPSPRSHHTLSYAPAQGCVLLQGGSDGTADSWTWNGTSWTAITNTPNPASAQGRMFFDAARSKTVIFADDFLAQHWEWDGATWRRQQSSGSLITSSAAISWDSSRARCVHVGVASTNVDEWSGGSWMSIPSSGTPIVQLAALAFDSARNRTVLFGGLNPSTGILLDATFEWDGSFWRRVTPSGNWPHSRTGHTLVYDAGRNRILMLGGWYGNYPPFTRDEVWEWDGNLWTQGVSLPIGRAFHAACFDSRRSRVIVHAGMGPNGPLGDTWALEGSSWTLLADSSTETRRNHCMTYDASRDRCIAFGGIPSGGTWELVFPSNATTYGTGCGTPPLLASPRSLPTLGQTSATRLDNVPSSLVLMSIGFSNTTTSGFPLPIPLDGFGMPGCSIYHDFAYTSTDPCNSQAAGAATHTLPLPLLPQLLGAHVYLEAWAYAPGMNAAELVTSNGIDILLGNQ